MKVKAILILSLIILVLSSGKGQESSTVFNLEGSSQIAIINTTNDSLPLSIENWQAIPLEAQRLDTILPPSGSFTYNLRTLGRSYYDLTMGEDTYKLFTQPTASDTLIALHPSKSGKVKFSGDLKEVNQFLLDKARRYGSPDADWKPRASATHSAENFNALISLNDSLTREHISFLQQNSERLPEWYVRFETQRLNYLTLGFKINSYFYRKRLLGKEEKFPENFLDEIQSTVKIDNPEMLGNMRYYYFLTDYLSYRKDPTFSSPRPLSKKELQKSYDAFFTTVDKELQGMTRDFFLSSKISRIISQKRHILDASWIAKVKDESMRKFLQQQLATREVLPKESPLPYFYLQGRDGRYYEPKDFKDRILLINFWASWCKPCIEEFPEENKLVEKYTDQPVTILNIGVESEYEQWNKLVEKYELKTFNLIAQGNWSELLSEKFDIKGLPHSVLIDWKGKVVQNKCLRASAGIDQQIDELLNKMKAETGGGDSSER